MNNDRDPILLGDARVVLPEALVPDVMIVDPPYRAHVHDNATSQDQHTDGNVRHNDFGFASLTEELRTWICQLAAKTRRWSLIYTDVESVAKWKDTLELAGATYIRTLPWVRWSMPALSGDRPPQGFECIVVAYGSNRGRKRWNGAGNLVRLAHLSTDWDRPDDLLAFLAESDECLTHIAQLALRGKDKFKTEKPLDQLLDLVSWFSERGEVVADPCAGSSTCGVACKILGRKFIGCELDAEWWEKGNARIRSCNPNDLPGSLSSRDSERFLRWVTTSEKERVNAGERKENTDCVRKRLADKKAFLSVVPSNEKEEAMVDVWAEAYQRCLTEICAPLPASPGIDGARMQEWKNVQAAEAAERHMPQKTSAADRTVPLFDSLFEDGYRAKAWRQAYERAMDEVVPPGATMNPQPIPEGSNGLSPALSGWATAEIDPTAHRIAPIPVAAPPAAPMVDVTSVIGELIFRDPPAAAIEGYEVVPCPGAPACPYGKDYGHVHERKIGATPPAEKRGKGRPPGVKNKAPPKAWKQAHARVMTELTPPS